jgi:excisionase family DNA binding protein
MSKDIMTPKQAAEYLGVSKPTIYKLLRKRKIPARRLGYQWRISKVVLDRFMEGKIK